MKSNYKIAAVVEARMNSSRLPGKVLLPAAGKPMLHHLIKRLRAVSNLDEIILATTTKMMMISLRSLQIERVWRVLGEVKMMSWGE